MKAFTVVDRQPTSVAYLRYTRAVRQKASLDFWMRLVAPWMEDERSVSAEVRNRHDDRASTAAEKLREETTAVESAEALRLEGPAITRRPVLPGGKYAVVPKFKRAPITQVVMHGTWLLSPIGYRGRRHANWESRRSSSTTPVDATPPRCGAWRNSSVRSASGKTASLRFGKKKERATRGDGSARSIPVIFRFGPGSDSTLGGLEARRAPAAVLLPKER